RTPRVAVPDVRDIRVRADEIELTARPWWLQGRELHVLILKNHFECVFPVYLSEVIGNLNRRSDFIGRKECVAAQGLQSVDPKSRQSSVFLLLGNTLDAILARQVCQVVRLW